MRCPCRPHRTGLKSNRRSDLSLSAEAARTRRASVTIATRGTRLALDRTARALPAVAASIVSSPPLPRHLPPRSAGDYAQVSSGGSSWIGLLARCVRRSLLRSSAAPLCLRHLPPRGGGRGEMEITRRSPRSWIGLFARCVRRSLLRSSAAPLCLRHLPPRSGGRGGMEITRRSPRGEQLDRTARALPSAVAASIVSSPLSAFGISPRGSGGRGKMEITRRSPRGGSSWIGLLARCVRRSPLRSSAARLCPLPAQGQASASPPAKRGESHTERS